MKAALALALLPVTLGAAPAPREVTVPRALLAVTSAPELSGLAWAAALDRFLVVSDDTGREDVGGGRHAPFVLAMSSAGALDAEPVPIVGVDELDDAEALCAGPEGTFLLATSHSPNKKGKTRPPRRQVLWLGLEGRTLAVRGKLDLTALEGGTLLERAGLPADGRLDLEAAAFHEGALYLGLKSPLGADGRAAIVRVEGVLEALKSGRLLASAVSAWARPALCVGGGKRRVCQGVSDLAFLPGGGAVVSANAPKGGPTDEGGALWLLASPDAAPRLLQRFEKLKPEAVAVTPRGTLAVLFDRDRAAPRWLELPLPRAADAGAP